MTSLLESLVCRNSLISNEGLLSTVSKQIHSCLLLIPFLSLSITGLPTRPGTLLSFLSAILLLDSRLLLAFSDAILSMFGVRIIPLLWSCSSKTGVTAVVLL